MAEGPSYSGRGYLTFEDNSNVLNRSCRYMYCGCWYELW